MLEENVLVPEKAKENVEMANKNRFGGLPETFTAEVPKYKEKIEMKESSALSAYERIFEKVRSWTSSKRQVTPSNSVAFDADAILHMQNSENRISKLLELALVKGPIHAISVAQHIDDYTLDKTRDRLTDELSEELRKRGLLPETNE